VTSTRNVVVVAGVHGVSGRAAAEHWARVPDTAVYGLSRRTAAVPEGVRSIRVDLLDPQDVKSKLSSVQGVTHIVFGAYIEKSTAAEKSAVNVALLKPARCSGGAARQPRAHHVLSRRQRLWSGPWAVQDTATRGRSATDAAQLLVRSGRLPARAAEGQRLALDCPSAGSDLRVRHR